MPLLEAYRAIREGAALVRRDDRGSVALVGRDRASFLQGLVTNDVERLEPGSGCYAAFLTPQGRLITDVRIFETGDSLLLVLPAATAPAIRERLEACIFSEDVQVEDLSAAWTMFSVYGPASGGVVATAVGADRQAAWVPYRNVRVQGGEHSIVVAASDEVGVAGWDCFVARAEADPLRRRLIAAGAVEVAHEAVDVVRVESGVPAFGVDMDESTIPLEAGLEARAISFTKGCYVGQEVIVRVRDRGHGRVARRLVGVLVDGDRVLARGDAVRVGNRDVGRLTSVVESPALGRAIALAVVHRDVAEPGTRVAIAHGAEELTATVAPLPFVPVSAGS